MTPEAYLERVRALLPALRERAEYAERLRRLPDETLKDFQEAGLFRALQLKRYGGDLRLCGQGCDRLRPDGTLVPRNAFVGDPLHRVDLR